MTKSCCAYNCTNKFIKSSGISFHRSQQKSDSDDELPSLAERIKASLLLQNQKNSNHISSDSEDEDSSFLKFSERIRNTPYSEVKLNQNEISDKKITEESQSSKEMAKNNPPPLNIKLDFSLTSESEDEESEFLSFYQKIQGTPLVNLPTSEILLSDKAISDKKNIEESKFSKDREKNNPPLNIKLDFSLSDSEDEESEFLNFSQKIRSTPQVKAPMPQIVESCYISSDSSDDEIFSNLSEKLSMFTPKIEDKENCDVAVGSHAVEKLNEFRTPLPPIKNVSFKVTDSESDESFSTFVELLRTPLSVNRKFSHKAVDSESDESFSSFIEKMKTPLSVNKKLSYKVKESESDESFTSFIEKMKTPLSINKKVQNRVTESDSDDSFLNISRRRPFQTPRSQIKSQKEVSLSDITNTKQSHSPLTTESIPNSVKMYKTENEKEFSTLFQPENIDSTFLRKRKTYTHMLYEFFNRKVFDLQLPPDMPLFYDGSLKTTAGMTCGSYKNGVRACSIKLSPSLMTSFDHLKDTLLHEMCHAAVWMINQTKAGHGPLWQTWASRCKLILPFIDVPTRCHNYTVSYTVWYQCTKCQWKVGRCKQVRKYHGALCKRCKTPITMTYS